MLANSQPTSASRVKVAEITALAEVASGIRIGDEAADTEMQICCSDAIDQRPQAARIVWCAVPARKIGAGIEQGECRRKVEPDQRVFARLRRYPVGDCRAGPTASRADQLRRRIARLGDGQGQALRAGDGLARPINCSKPGKSRQAAGQPLAERVKVQLRPPGLAMYRVRVTFAMPATFSGTLSCGIAERFMQFSPAQPSIRQS